MPATVIAEATAITALQLVDTTAHLPAVDTAALLLWHAVASVAGEDAALAVVVAAADSTAVVAVAPMAAADIDNRR
jgi:hypothetical protein